MAKVRCAVTNRRWIVLGKLAIGFGPVAFLERIKWGDKMLYANLKALRIAQMQRLADRGD